MKRAIMVSIVSITTFYLLCGSIGYATFGDYLLIGFGSYYYNHLYWLVDIANLAVVVHLIGAYQVFSQPLLAFVENWAAHRWSRSEVFTEYGLPELSGSGPWLFISQLQCTYERKKFGNGLEDGFQFYVVISPFGYATLGDHAPGNLLAGFGFYYYNLYWLLGIANFAVVVHLIELCNLAVFVPEIFEFPMRSMKLAPLLFL
ncbi:amino acid permease 2-like protein [Trifolium pratense]|uniref:Amino acid permease 2-like protein n=1 Tax=Trifolium pratense TaxID=57577 RepID=A0A2K3NQI8_TRIPR|nr:amino acid permease 2-like protein [Trifolium pratense]